jgi:D-arginine dehydrogenase
MSELAAGETLLDRRGLVLAAARENTLAQLLNIAAALGVDHRPLKETELQRRAPFLAGGCCNTGVLLPGGGVLDIHALGEVLRRRLAHAGAKLQTAREVARICVARGEVRGVELTNSETIAASTVVIAAGAWSGRLGETCGCPMDLRPHRRHLVQLLATPATPRTSAVAWNVDSGVYLRHEGSGVLACPGDHVPHAPGLPSVDPAELERLARLLPQTAPALRHAEVQRAWACLRTMSSDLDPAIGPDPRLPGLFWLSGLGGFGMTAGLAAGELLARIMEGREDQLSNAVNPGRLLKPAPQV